MEVLKEMYGIEQVRSKARMEHIRCLEDMIDKAAEAGDISISLHTKFISAMSEMTVARLEASYPDVYDV